MEIEERDFDALVSGFYQAATGGIPWETALEGVHAAFRTRTTALHSADLSNGHIVQVSYAGAPMPEAWLDFVRRWHVLDFRRNHLLTHADELNNRWWHCHEHFDESWVSRDRFYQQFLVGTGVRYEATAVFLPAEGIGTGLSLELSAARGPLTADERHWAQRLSHHVGEALRLYERIRRLSSEALMGHTLLDAMAHPMWLLDAGRYIRHANAAALEWASQSPHVEARSHRLFWSVDKVDRLLGEVLADLGGHVRHGHRRLIDARASKEDAPLWLHVHAMEPQRVLGGIFGHQPVVLITLFDARRMGELDTFALSEIFDMTPAESRVAALLAEGLPAEAIGERLGCQASTVRSHIREVLGKLGASRSSEAIRLLRQGESLWSHRMRTG